METKEKEILSGGNKKKSENLKKEFINIQTVTISELTRKLIKNSVPIEFKIFSNKYLKLKEFEPNDSLDRMTSKIDENIEMYYLINLNY